MMLCTLIRNYRETQGMTLRELAKKIGVGYVSLHRFEHGKNLQLDAVHAILNWTLNGKPAKR